MFSATSETSRARADAQRLRFCPYRPFSPFLIGASEGDDAQSPSPRHFAAVGPCDNRLKTERKRRRHTRRSFCRKQRSSSGHDASAATAESGANMRGSPWRRRRNAPQTRILRARAENTYYGHWPENFGWRIKGRWLGQCPTSPFASTCYPQIVDHRCAPLPAARHV
jgi:hypothetical protein